MIGAGPDELNKRVVDGALAGAPSTTLTSQRPYEPSETKRTPPERYPILRMLGIAQVMPARITIAAPMSTKHALTPMASANKVDATSPTGIAQLQTAPYRPKTRPMHSGSTRSCMSAICGALYSGLETPSRT